MHIAPHDNRNQPIVDVDHPLVPLNYFNIVTLKRGEDFSYAVPGYETCIVPATGTIRVEVGGQRHDDIGQRGTDVWDGEPEGVYVPTGMTARMICQSDSAEVFVAGARFDSVLESFAVRAADIDKIQYGSDDTKTHRKIKHILGTKYHGRVGRLLVSELFTVGTGGWSGFPSHKHDTVRLPEESRQRQREGQCGQDEPVETAVADHGKPMQLEGEDHQKHNAEPILGQCGQEGLHRRADRGDRPTPVCRQQGDGHGDHP